MSGNSKSRRSGSLGRGGGSGEDVCLLLVIEISLFSPDEDVIKTLKKGSKLKITYSGTGNRVQAETSKGEVAGSIIGDKIVQLLRCIKDGHSYVAEVIEIKGGNCKVKITHA